MSLLQLFHSPASSAAIGVASGRSVDLFSFVSVYADPGNRIVPSQGTDIQGNLYDSLTGSNTYSEVDQAQRQKNFRIFMEACLYACGGTGAANGPGWYANANNTATEASPGSVFVPGPFWIEPYDTSGLPATQNYAPQFGATLSAYGFGFWTLPAWLTLWGFGGTAGGGSVNANLAVWGGYRSRLAPRIIVVNSYLGWHPGGGPTASGGRDLNGFCVDGIAVERRGSTSGDVFHIEDYQDSSDSGPVYVANHWKIKSLYVGQDGNTYGGARNVTHGCVIRGGLNSDTYELNVCGNGNAGWGLIVSNGFNHSRTELAIGDSLTTHFRKVLVQGGLRGVAYLGANLLMDSLNLESPSPAPLQFVLNGVGDGRLGYLHTELGWDPATGAVDDNGTTRTASSATYVPDPSNPGSAMNLVDTTGWATDSATVVVGGLAPGAAEGLTTAYFPGGIGVQSSTLSIDQANITGAHIFDSDLGSLTQSQWDARMRANPQYAIQVNVGRLTLGHLTAGGQRANALRIQPVGNDGAAELVYDSKTILGGYPWASTVLSASTSAANIWRYIHDRVYQENYALSLADPSTTPGAVSGRAVLYVDPSDGDLKVRFGDGTIKLIVTDT